MEERRLRLMGAWEIQRALGISRSRTHELMLRATFPKELDPTLRGARVFYEHEVMAWIQEHRAKIAEEPEGE